jgi:hypothetical protein
MNQPGRRTPNSRTLGSTYTANHTLNADKAHIETLLDGVDARLLLSNRLTVTTGEVTCDTKTLIFHAKWQARQGHLTEGFIKKVTNIDGWHRVKGKCPDGQKRIVRFSRDEKGKFAAEITLKRNTVKITP